MRNPQVPVAWRCPRSVTLSTGQIQAPPCRKRPSALSPELVALRKLAIEGGMRPLRHAGVEKVRKWSWG